jgi:hypothetical protein
MKTNIEVEIPKGCYCYFLTDNKPTPTTTECQFFDENDGFGVWDYCTLFHKCLDRVDKNFPTIKCQQCIHKTGTLAEIKKVHDYKRKELNGCKEDKKRYIKIYADMTKECEKGTRCKNEIHD